MAEIKMTYMMISIVTIFLICHSSECIYIFIQKFVELEEETKIVVSYMYAILVNFSAGINTLIYCIFNREFKKKFLKLVTLECFKNAPTAPTTSTALSAPTTHSASIALTAISAHTAPEHRLHQLHQQN